MAGWYRRFIENFAAITAPITECLKKGKFNWSDDAQSGFDEIKRLMTTAPVLVNPEYDQPFWIRCDASNEGVGAVLYQKDGEENERPIAFMSQKLKEPQRKYCTTELECLAALLAVKKFRPYIEGHKFTIITDHASLKWLMNQRDLSGRLARWSLKLQGLNFEIVHQKGTENVVPDALSRIHCETINELISNIPKLAAIDLESQCFDDEEYVNFRKNIVTDPEKFEIFKVHGDRIYIRLEPKVNDSLSDVSIWKLWIPKPMRIEMLKQEHDNPLSAHSGVVKTLERLRRYVFWPKMVKEVRDYISKCEICKVSKPPNKQMKPPMGKLEPVDRPFQKIYIDLLGPYPRTSTGKTMVFIVIDNFTKFVYLKAINQGSAVQICKVLRDDIFCVFGVPEKIRCDNGRQFESNEYLSLLREFGIKDSKTAVYSPQSNQSERVNRSIIVAIRSYLLDKHTLWDKFLPEIACALRNSIHETVKYSPHYLLFGYNKINHGSDYKLLREINAVSDGELLMPLPIRLSIVHDEVKRNIVLAYEKSAHQYNLRTRIKSYDVGQTVYVRLHPLSDASKKFCAKFAPQFAKAIVSKRIGTVNYELKNDSGKILGVYHAKDIK